MTRAEMLQNLNAMSGQTWDMLIIGGGATGLGTAVEAASRGYNILLLEQEDFAKGTSSRSTKLVHGGVRYLQQGNIALVLEALKERGLLIKNAPHLVQNLSFIVPNYKWWSGPFYGIGLKLYDLLAGDLGLGPSQFLSIDETLEHIPTLETNGLKGGIIYQDGQFDDSRLAINLAQTAVDHQATAINYFKVNNLIKEKNLITGVLATDQLSGNQYEIKAKVVINATGVFTQSILQMDNPGMKNIIKPSQGIHLVLDKHFLPGKSAIMVPHTDDGRVLFAVPWHNKVVVGTTDTLVSEPSLEPRALNEEIEFIMTHIARYLTKDPDDKDVKSVFAGLRPLVKNGNGNSTSTLSRDHTLLISESGLVTITGGKWTTYRKMGQDTVEQALVIAGLKEQPSITQTLRIHGWTDKIDLEDELHYYGSDAEAVKSIADSEPDLAVNLHPDLPYIKAEVIWAVRNEMAMTVEDILSRRTRALLLDANASIEIAEETAKLMAKEMKKDDHWQKDQVQKYIKIAEGYLLNRSYH